MSKLFRFSDSQAKISPIPESGFPHMGTNRLLLSAFTGDFCLSRSPLIIKFQVVTRGREKREKISGRGSFLI